MKSPKGRTRTPGEVELRHLRYAAEIIRLRGIKKAEAICQAKQPTMSRQMRQLEKKLGNIKLFDRKPFKATRAGEIFESEARDILRRTSKLVEGMREMAAGKFRNIRVGYADSPTKSFRSKAFKAFTKKTGIGVEHEDLSSIEILNGLRDNHLDVGLTIQLPPRMTERLLFKDLLTFPVCVAVRVDHPLARYPRIQLSDLKGLRFIGFSEMDYPEYPLWVLPLLHRIGADLSEEYKTAAGLDTAVANDDGVSLIASCFAERISKDVRVLRLDPSPTTVAVGAAYYPDVKLAEKFLGIVGPLVSGEGGTH